MAVLPIAKLGNPVLRKVAAQVDTRDIRTKEFQQLIDDMRRQIWDFSTEFSKLFFSYT